MKSRNNRDCDGPRALLINPNRMKPPVGPIGLDLVAEACEKAGVSVRIVDLSWERAPYKALREALRQHRPHAVGLSIRNIDDCYYASQAFMLPAARRWVEAIKKETKAPVVLGGVGFSMAPGAVLEYLGADLGVRGDGEKSFPELVKQIGAGRKPEVPGLVLPGGADPMPAMDGLAALPSPKRGCIDLPRYFRLGGQGNIETSRGCNKKCIYCADTTSKGKRVQRKAPDAVADEIASMLEMGVHTFHTCDAEFNLSRRHVEAVCKELIGSGLHKKIAWYTYALPAPMDDALAGLMAKAGCKGVDFSVDAGCDEMLTALGRDFHVEDVERCARSVRRAGMPFMYDLLLGGPGETWQTMEETVGRMKKLRPDRVGVSFGMRIVPGSAAAKAILAEGPLSDNPNVQGVTRDNDSLIRPVFYVSDKLGPDPEARLKRLIDDDPIFLFASQDEFARNYNYNDNKPLCDAIRKGARGAYWDIIRRMSKD